MRPKARRRRTARPTTKKAPARRWSGDVTARSNALDLEPGVFTQRSPRAIAASLRRSAERSRRRKTDAFRSAMSMLTFFVNRAGRNLAPGRRRTLERAKDELRRLYGRWRPDPDVRNASRVSGRMRRRYADATWRRGRSTVYW